jgi:ADP-heptose:LPS heptosyltransferase
MAQTWPFSRKRRALLRVADFFGRWAAAPIRRAGRPGPPPAPESIHRILVIEPWHIGDVVLVTPFLRELRRRYTQAKISILAKPHARELLEASGLVDDVIAFDLPWTAQRNKLRRSLRSLREIKSLVRTLKARRFDMTVDSRMDIRSNLLAAMTGAPYRVGYDIGGGGWLLTHALPSNRDDSHKIHDWLALVGVLDNATTVGEPPRPTLVVTEEERKRARRKLAEAGANASPLIAYHPGGSHAGKRWPRDQFEALMRGLSASIGGSHIVFLGPGENDPREWPSNVIVFREPLREMMALLTCCDVLVCNDSGPMHVADALGVPVVAIFEVGNPQWFGPSGKRAVVIHGEHAGRGISAAPLEVPPRNPVAVPRVAAAVQALLSTSK